MPGAFYLDNLQTFKPLLFQKSTSFLLPYWRAYSSHSVIGIILRKGRSPNSETLVSDKIFLTSYKIVGTWGSSIWVDQMRQFTAF